MGTQAVVALVAGGQVRLKAICGINGAKADALADWLHSNPNANAQALYDHARQIRFGDEDDLVVMDKDIALFAFDEELNPLYRETFADPHFNPRWECGLADIQRVVTTSE